MADITLANTFPGVGGADPYVATGNPTQYSGTFIPTLWSGKLIEKFYDASVLAAISNTDYEGEIANYGDQVIIRQKPTLNVTEYEAGTTLNYERPVADTKSLLINKGFYWGTELDDVMEVQADIDMMSMWADDASEQMKIKIDTEVLDTGMWDKATDVTNRGAAAGRLSQNIDLGVTTSPRTLTSSNIIDVIIDCGLVLDEQNVPEGGRFMTLPAWACALIKKSELQDASLTGDSTSLLRNGRLGQIDRFTLYMSNLLPNDGSDTAVLAAGETGSYFGTSHATTFASQVTKVETLRAESTFANIMRGLQVYGREVIKPEALGQLVIAAG